MSFSSNRLILVGIIAAIVVVGGAVGVVLYDTTAHSSTVGGICGVLKSGASAPGIANATSSSATAYFTIVEADPGSPYEGMNGSYYHLSTPWPVMEVEQGQKVVIVVNNCASSEPHGFAIDHYFDSGVSIPPGSSYTLTFVADQAGTFRVYCNIFCAIHPFMQNGQLIVTQQNVTHS